MKVLPLDVLSRLRVKSTSTKHINVQKVDYPKCQKHGYTIDYDHSNFFQATAKMIKW